MVSDPRDLTPALLPAADGRLPQVEVVTRPAWSGPDPAPADGPAIAPRRRGPRLLLGFVLPFLLVAVPGSLWNFSRPPVYRASATVLTIVPAARSGAGAAEADVQHVTIQRQVLLGEPLLAAARERLAAVRPDVQGLATADLRRLLDVTPLPETNLVELRATGGEPQLLATLVNEWLDAYQDQRDREIAAQVGDRLARLAERGDNLQATIAERRQALADFRARFDIVTLERDNNDALRRLNDLQTALAGAEDESIAARARAQAVEAAIANGETVASERLAPVLSGLQQEVAVLELQVKDLRERYTSMFIENDPEKRALPQQLAQTRARLEQVAREARTEALAGARQAVEASTGRVLALQRELADQRRQAARFSTGYAEYQALTDGLAELERVAREAEAERVALESTALTNYPQVEVIESAHAPRDPIGPPYLRDLLLTLAAAGGAGMIGLLLALALTASRRPAPMAVTGVRVYGAAPAAGSEYGRLGMAGGATMLDAPVAGALPAPGLAAGLERPPRALMPGEVAALWELAEPAGRQVIGLLLSGVAPEELPRLGSDAFDLAARLLHTPAPAERTLTLAPGLVAALAATAALPAWAGAESESDPEWDPARAPGGLLADLLARLPLLANDAGLAHAGEVTAALLRDTWLLWLVRQGARLTELHRVAGPVPAADLHRLARWSPPGPARPLAELDLAFPLPADAGP